MNQPRKRFSKAQATALIPKVEPLLVSIQATMQDAYELRLHLEELPKLSVEARNLRQELSFLFRIACSYSDELSALGVTLEDAEAGVVTFPADAPSFMTRYTWRKGDADVTETAFPLTQINPKLSSVSL